MARAASQPRPTPTAEKIARAAGIVDGPDAILALVTLHLPRAVGG